MKILIILPTVPYPLNSGGNQAMFHLIDNLRKEMSISLLLRVPKEGEKSLQNLMKLWPDVIMHPFKQKRDLKFILNRILFIVREYVLYRKLRDMSTISPDAFYTEELLSYVNDVVSQNSYDIIQTEFYNNLHLVYGLPSNVKKIFVQHEIHYVINELRIKKQNNVPALKQFMWSKLRNEEISAMNAYDAVITLTETDKIKLIETGVSKPIFASPAVICFNEERNPIFFENKIVFVGGCVHSPNIEGVKWFLKNVWPIIYNYNQNITFNIVGEWRSEFSDLIIREYKNVIFKGFVPSLKGELKGAISIIPILTGSGMRMKILDAVNIGSPFVTTSIGVEGLDFKNNFDCFIADTAEEFAKKTIELIDSDKLRKKFYYNSITTLNEKYSVNSLLSKRKLVYEHVIKQNL